MSPTINLRQCLHYKGKKFQVIIYRAFYEIQKQTLTMLFEPASDSSHIQELVGT